MPMGRDPLTEMVPAGKAGAAAANTSSMAGTLAGYQAPPTPDKLKPFRSSGKGAVGGQVSHYSRTSSAPVPDIRFGRANTYDQSTATRFAEMREPIFQPKSRAYASDLREPLGKSMSYKFNLPAETEAPDFRFGKSTTKSEPVKAVMNPPEGTGDLPQNKQPMHQVQRNYDWAKVQMDPTEFRFGATSKKDAPETYKPTTLVPLPTVEQRQQHQSEVGVPKTAGYAPSTVKGQTFGLTLNKNRETMQQVMSHNADPPSDLGAPFTKSTTLRKLKAQDVANGTMDATRSFGMPSIRSDKAPPKLLKVANNVNFGDEPSTDQLLFPAPDTSGATTKVLADVDAAEALSNRCRFGLSRSDVARAFAEAARLNGNTVTAKAFKKAVDDLGM